MIHRDNRTVGIMLRVNPGEHAQIIHCAETVGLSVSAWIRMQLLGVLNAGKGKKRRDGRKNKKG